MGGYVSTLFLSIQVILREIFVGGGEWGAEADHEVEGPVALVHGLRPGQHLRELALAVANHKHFAGICH